MRILLYYRCNNKNVINCYNIVNQYKLLLDLRKSFLTFCRDIKIEPKHCYSDYQNCVPIGFRCQTEHIYDIYYNIGFIINNMRC